MGFKKVLGFYKKNTKTSKEQILGVLGF